METARSAFPVMRSSPCDRLTVHAGRYEGPLPVEAACGGKDHISNLKISKDSTAIRSITPIPSSSSSINAYPTRNEGLLLSSSGTKDSFAVKPIRPPFVNNQTQNSDLHFDEIQPSHQDLSPALRRDFDHFTARVALIDVELWAASWLRAETNYENKIDLRAFWKAP